MCFRRGLLTEFVTDDDNEENEEIMEDDGVLEVVEGTEEEAGVSRRSWSKSNEARGGVCTEYTSPMAESKLTHDMLELALQWREREAATPWPPPPPAPDPAAPGVGWEGGDALDASAMDGGDGATSGVFRFEVGG